MGMDDGFRTSEIVRCGRNAPESQRNVCVEWVEGCEDDLHEGLNGYRRKGVGPLMEDK